MSDGGFEWKVINERSERQGLVAISLERSRSQDLCWTYHLERECVSVKLFRSFPEVFDAGEEIWVTDA